MLVSKWMHLCTEAHWSGCLRLSCIAMKCISVALKPRTLALKCKKLRRASANWNTYLNLKRLLFSDDARDCISYSIYNQKGWTKIVACSRCERIQSMANINLKDYGRLTNWWSPSRPYLTWQCAKCLTRSLFEYERWKWWHKKSFLNNQVKV